MRIHESKTFEPTEMMASRTESDLEIDKLSLSDIENQQFPDLPPTIEIERKKNRESTATTYYKQMKPILNPIDAATLQTDVLQHPEEATLEVNQLLEDTHKWKMTSESLHGKKKMAEEEVEQLKETLRKTYEQQPKVIQELKEAFMTMQANATKNSDNQNPKSKGKKVKYQSSENDDSDDDYQPKSLRIKIPDPPKFTSESADTLCFEDWKDRMEKYLFAQRKYFSSEEDKMMYVESRVEGIAAKHISARCRFDHEEAYTTANEILDHLDMIYGEVDGEEKAEAELEKLYMKERESFQEFHAKFEILCEKAKVRRSERSRKLLRKLRPDLGIAVNEKYHSRPSYDRFAQFCRTTDDILTQFKTRQAKYYNGKSRPERVQSAYQLAKDTNRTSTTTNAIDQATPSAQRARPVYDSAELQKLSKEGKCFNCYEKGHMSRDCPNPRRPRVAEVVGNESAMLGKEDP